MMHSRPSDLQIFQDSQGHLHQFGSVKPALHIVCSCCSVAPSAAGCLRFLAACLPQICPAAVLWGTAVCCQLPVPEGNIRAMSNMPLAATRPVCRNCAWLPVVLHSLPAHCTLLLIQCKSFPALRYLTEAAMLGLVTAARLSASVPSPSASMGHLTKIDHHVQDGHSWPQVL